MFQFPPNGKAYPKFSPENLNLNTEEIQFQFPPNGKAYPKTIRAALNDYKELVSIPSERESISKADGIT